MHLDLYAGDAADQAAEVERLVSFVAERVHWDRYNEGSDLVVLADTEGNRFCVIDTGGGGRDAARPTGSHRLGAPAA